jgi:hypothetical protein
MRKEDVLFVPTQFQYFFKLYPDFDIKFYETPKDIPELFLSIEPQDRILINLHEGLTKIKGMDRFELRVGRYSCHRFPNYNILIKGDGLGPIMNLLDRRSRKRLTPKFSSVLRGKISSLYQRLRRHYRKIVYVALKTGFEPKVDYFYAIEGTGDEKGNMKSVLPGSQESLAMSYYADEYLGPESFHTFLRRTKR